MSFIARELSNVPSTEVTRVLEKHPRYKELCEVYGEPEIASKARAVDGEPEPGTLAARIVKFTFWLRSDEGDEGTDAKAATIIEKTKEIPRTIDIYQLKGIVGRLFNLRPMKCRLIWETGEWDPVKGEEDGWSCSEEEELAREALGEREREPQDGTRKQKQKKKHGKPGAEPEKWTRRETELVDGTRNVGFWIEGREARVRVERR